MESSHPWSAIIFSNTLFCVFPVVDRQCLVLARQCRKKKKNIGHACVLQSLECSPCKRAFSGCPHCTRAGESMKAHRKQAVENRLSHQRLSLHGYHPPLLGPSAVMPYNCQSRNVRSHTVQVDMALNDKGQQYGNLDESSAMARVPREGLVVRCGDHKQTPGRLRKSDEARASGRQLMRRPIALRATPSSHYHICWAL